MNLGRILRHVLFPDWWVLRAFPKTALSKIEQAVRESERQHGGELRFVVEANLPMTDLIHGRSARDRAIELFSLLRVWDTEENSGVLIYVQLVDRQVEIVADRGITAKVDNAFWTGVCRTMESAFRDKRFDDGSLRAIQEITTALASHFPPGARNDNELPDAPVVY